MTEILEEKERQSCRLDPIEVDEVFIPARGCFENLYLLQGIMQDAKTYGSVTPLLRI